MLDITMFHLIFLLLVLVYRGGRWFWVSFRFGGIDHICM